MVQHSAVWKDGGGGWRVVDERGNIPLAHIKDIKKKTNRKTCLT